MGEREGGLQDAIGMAYPGPTDNNDFLIDFILVPKDIFRG